MIGLQIVLLLFLVLIKLRVCSDLPWFFVLLPAWLPLLARYLVEEATVLG